MAPQGARRRSAVAQGLRAGRSEAGVGQRGKSKQGSKLGSFRPAQVENRRYTPEASGKRMNQMCTETNASITQAYDRDGYYVAHKLLSEQECDALKAEALRVLREKCKPGATVMVGVAAASPMYYKLASDPRIVGVLDKIMPDGVAFMSDQFVYKSGDKRFATPWHVDLFYWRNTRPKLSVWIALDRVGAENGALKVVRGSHKKTWVAKNNAAMAATNGEFGQVIEQESWTREEEVVCEIEKGSAIFFSDNLVHGSTTNTSGLDRYAIISTYQAPAAVEDAFDRTFAARHDIIKR